MNNHEAIATIRDFTNNNGRPMVLDEVNVLHPGEDASLPVGIGLDRDCTIEVEGLDTRYSPTGKVSGLLACRAVVVLPGEASGAVLGQQFEDGGTLLRVRFAHEEPETELSMGGTVTNTAVYALGNDDPKALDEYFASFDQYWKDEEAYWEAVNKGDNRPFGSINPPVQPERPFVSARYSVDMPLTKSHADDDADGMKLNSRTFKRLDLYPDFVRHMQEQHPGTVMLSNSSNGVISPSELPTFAEWFTRPQ